jgi:hypothetical protein
MVMRKIKIRLLGEAGQSLVEFALVTLFVILPVTFGIIDGGVLFYKWVTLNNGAREGARTGAIFHYVGVDPSWQEVDAVREGVIKNAVDATVVPLVDIAWGDLPEDWVSYPDSPCMDPNEELPDCKPVDVYRSGDRLEVSLTHHHRPFVGLVIGLDQIDLTATATMRIEPGGAGPPPTPP